MTKDAPTVFNVRPEILHSAIAVVAAVITVEVAVTVFVAVTAVVAAAAVLFISRDVTVVGFTIKFRLRCLSVKLFILFLQESYLIL